MSKYKWDLREIRDYKEAADEAILLVDDEYRKKRLTNISNLYESMLSIFHKNDNSLEHFNDSLYEYDLMNILDDPINFFTEDNLPFIDAVIGAFPTIIDNYQPDDYIDGTIFYDDDNVVGIAEDFFKKMTLPWMQEEFNNIISINPSIINISYNKNKTDFSGVIFVDDVMDKKYIHVTRCNHLDDLCILPHEVFHYIFDKNDFSIKYKSKFLNEVEGCLANILFSDYYQNNAIINNDYFNDHFKYAIQTNIEDLSIRAGMLKFLELNPYININLKKFNKFLKPYGYNFKTQEQLYSYLTIPSERRTKFSLSYLVALDLYYIYKDDPEKCFALLKEIKDIYTDDYLNDLSKYQITFMEDDYKSLEKFLNK